MLHADWPSVGDIDGVIHQSSGQFIYAATVMRFILHSSASPNLSLQRVQGVAQNANSSPFSQLDAIYTYILCQANDQQALKDFLHTHFLIQIMLPFENDFFPDNPDWSLKFQHTLSNYNQRYTNSVLHSCTADVASIARLKNDKLVFYHASLQDYFNDQSRSGEYFVDVDAFNVKILPALLERAKQRKDGRHT